jgi:hypothetical protein
MHTPYQLASRGTVYVGFPTFGFHLHLDEQVPRWY